LQNQLSAIRSGDVSGVGVCVCFLGFQDAAGILPGHFFGSDLCSSIGRRLTGTDLLPKEMKRE
jgi:hypothetical protein